LSIVRAPRRDRYTVIDNLAIEDSRLSFRALGLLVYILSKPDHWRTNREHLADTHQDSVTAVRAALRELSDAGYITREPNRCEDGTVRGWVAQVHEVAVAKAQVEPSGHAPTVRSPTGRSPEGRSPAPLVSKEVASTEVVKTEVAKPSAPAAEAQTLPLGETPAEVARRLVTAWWETQDPRPQQPFVAVVKIVGKALRSGWSESEIQTALDEVPTVSGSTLDMWRNRRTQPPRNGAAPPGRALVMTDRSAPGGRWRPPGKQP
jgi:hypothetical protein